MTKTFTAVIAAIVVLFASGHLGGNDDVITYRYKRRHFGPWWAHVTAWRFSQPEDRRGVRWAPGAPSTLVAPLTRDRRYILYVVLRPWRVWR